jgi:hypothetical protein
VRNFKAAKLVIVGEALFNRDFEHADVLHDAAKRLGISDGVLFLGQREDIPELTRAFDLAIAHTFISDIQKLYRSLRFLSVPRHAPPENSKSN